MNFEMKDSNNTLLKNYIQFRASSSFLKKTERDTRLFNRILACCFAVGFVASVVRIISLLNGVAPAGILMVFRISFSLVFLLGAIGFYRAGWKHKTTIENGLGDRIHEATQDVVNIVGKETVTKINEALDAYDRKQREQLLQSKKPFRPLAIVLFAGGIGTLLEVKVGDQFIFSAANQYRTIAYWAFAVLVPFWGWFWYRAEQVIHCISRHRRYPTKWFQKLILFPMITLVASALSVIGPLGWFAANGWLFGTQVTGVEAKIIHVGTLSKTSRGCHQNATIALDGNTVSICLADVLSSGRTPAPGETVLLSGRLSRMGLYIDRLSRR